MPNLMYVGVKMTELKRGQNVSPHPPGCEGHEKAQA